MIRVLVVANSAMARAGLADVVRGDARLVLAGTATPGDLAARVRELDPDVRAIVSSGYDNDDIARQYLDMGFCGYLTKPYRVADLGKVLKAVLG